MTVSVTALEDHVEEFDFGPYTKGRRRLSIVGRAAVNRIVFDERLRTLEGQQLLRRLTPLDSRSGATVEIDGRRVILLASNDYLGLANDKRVLQAAVTATEQFGAGAGASRLVCGSLPPHQDLEAALARFKGAEAALSFGSGYLANLGIIPTLAKTGDLILADRLCHASLIDGCRLSGANLRIYRHCDVDQVRSLLERHAGKRKVLIVTDGLFSMDGDVAPLQDLVELADTYDALLYVDDAHGTGVMGTTGRGTLEHCHVEPRIPFHMGTLGKALGASGAYIVGSAAFVQYLINTCRSFMYTTAPPPASTAAAWAALDVIAAEPQRRTQLWENRRYLYSGLHRLGFRLTATRSPIMPILIGDPALAVSMAEQLLRQGVFAPAIRPPTVPKATSRIRVTVTASHTHDQLEEALAMFEKVGKSLHLI